MHGKTWADVGGLDGVRRTFEEMILWPAKYPGKASVHFSLSSLALRGHRLTILKSQLLNELKLDSNVDHFGPQIPQ